MAARTLANLGLKGGYGIGDDGWGDDQNDNLLKLSVLVQGGVKARLAAVPGGPAEGDIYILTAAPHAQTVAVYDNGAWSYFVPMKGWLLYDNDEEVYVSYDGDSWEPLAASGGGGGGGIEEAPIDGTPYARQDGDWVPTDTGGGGGPVVPPEFHAYWRMYCTVNNGNMWTGLNELQFLDPDENQVATSGGTVIFSADDGVSFGGAPEAFNGTTTGNGHWQDHVTTGAWIGYHFAAPVAVQGIKMWGCYFPDQTPRDFEIQYSDDGASWTGLYAVTGATAWSAGEQRKFMNPDYTNVSGRHQYWGLFDLVPFAINGFSQVQAIHWTLEGGAAVYPVSYQASSFYNNDAAYNPNNLLDDTGSSWAANDDRVNWLVADFGDPQRFDMISMLGVNGQQNQSLHRFTIGYSDDGVAYKMLATYPVLSAWVDGVYKNYAIPSAN